MDNETTRLDPSRTGSGQASQPRQELDAGEVRLPVSEEELIVRKRQRATGRIRVRTITRTEDAGVSSDVETESADVERVPMDRVLDAMPAVREEPDGTIVVPVVEERVVLHTQLVLREEVRIKRKRTRRTVTLPATRRFQDVLVERLPPASPDTPTLDEVPLPADRPDVAHVPTGKDPDGSSGTRPLHGADGPSTKDAER